MHFVHRVAVTWIPKVRWTFDEIPKMSPGGARTHDPAATLSKLQPNLGIQVTAARCSCACLWILCAFQCTSICYYMKWYTFIGLSSGEPDSGIFKVRHRMNPALHPRYLSNLTLGLVNHFNELINHYHPDLEGILAGFGKIFLRRPDGHFLNEEAHIHLDVAADFWVFRPSVGAQVWILSTYQVTKWTVQYVL